MTDQFKRQVQEFKQIDDEIKTANKALLTLKKRRTSLSTNINSYMLNNDLQVLKLQDCQIVTRVSTTTQGLTKDWIYQRLLLICKGNEDQAKGMCEFICDPKARPKKQKPTISRRALPKSKKTKQKN